MEGRKIPYSEAVRLWKDLKPSDIIVLPDGHEIDVAAILQAAREKAANEISETLSAHPEDFAITVDEGYPLLLGEGSQPVCGYQLRSFLTSRGRLVHQPCNLPRGHKPPHVCRVKIA